MAAARMFNWEDQPDDFPDVGDRWSPTGEWPDCAVHDDRMSLGWGALNALAFVVSLLTFAAGLLTVATTPPGEPVRGLVGLALVVLGGAIGTVAWGHAVAEQERDA